MRTSLEIVIAQRWEMAITDDPAGCSIHLSETNRKLFIEAIKNPVKHPVGEPFLTVIHRTDANFAVLQCGQRGIFTNPCPVAIPATCPAHEVVIGILQDGTVRLDEKVALMRLYQQNAKCPIEKIPEVMRVIRETFANKMSDWGQMSICVQAITNLQVQLLLAEREKGEAKKQKQS